MEVDTTVLLLTLAVVLLSIGIVVLIMRDNNIQQIQQNVQVQPSNQAQQQHVFLNDAELYEIYPVTEGVRYDHLFNGNLLGFNKLTIHDEVTVPVVLWWASVGGRTPGITQRCGQHSCYFTEDKRFRQHTLLKALMFYGSNLNWTDLPLPRGSEPWALLHEESPRNNRALGHPAALRLFNYTATFSRHSSYPLTTQYLAKLQDITDVKHFKKTLEKRRIAKKEGLAPVMYLQSDCSTPTDRDTYVAQLMKHIGIDSYGSCLHNKDLPDSLQGPNYLDTMLGEELLELTSRYMFTLALENGVCDDYVTEKLWRPLIAGSVAIYIGSPTVSDWLPNNKSAVLGNDFESPEKLSQYLLQLIENKEQYDSYLSHKIFGEVTNERLIREMNDREWSIDFENNYVHGFECYVCAKVHEKLSHSVATSEHYSCLVPSAFVTKMPNASNFWLDSWYTGRCEADFIRERVDSGARQITQSEIDSRIKDDIEAGKCMYAAGG